MTHINTRYHASLADEIAAILSTEGCWMSSHALLQRCELAKDGEALGATLARMVVAQQVQAHADRLGIVYAAPGLAKIVAESGRAASGPSSPAERPERDAPAPRADIAVAAPHANAAARRQATLQRMTALFQTQPRRTCRELHMTLGDSYSYVYTLLRTMVGEGKIEKVGAGMNTAFRWLGEPATTVDAEPSRAARASKVSAPEAPATAEEATGMAAAFSSAVWARREVRTGEVPISDAPSIEPPAPEPICYESVRESAQTAPEPLAPRTDGKGPTFALFSDGELLITVADKHVTRLPPPVVHGLIQFLRAARGAAEFGA